MTHRTIPTFAAPLLCLLYACPGGGGMGGAGESITQVPVGGCETDPFAGTCVADFARGDGCWDHRGGGGQCELDDVDRSPDA